jgi:hypothetical protein
MTLWDILAEAGLQGSAHFCLDAGDALSWSGSGQKWLDRSAGAYDWFRGLDGSAAGDDPSFTGAVGDLTNGTYWSLDGGDFFHYDGANEAFMNAWHHDNAAFTFLALVYVPSGTINGGIIGGSSNDLSPAVDWYFDAGRQRMIIQNSGAGGGSSWTADTAVPAGWHMLAVSTDEAVGAGGGFFYRDGAYDQVAAANTFNSAVTAPDGGNAGNVYNIGYGPSDGSGQVKLPNGVRVMGFAALNAAVSKAALDLVWARARVRLGL